MMEITRGEETRSRSATEVGNWAGSPFLVPRVDSKKRLYIVRQQTTLKMLLEAFSVGSARTTAKLEKFTPAAQSHLWQFLQTG